jgi:hypothetical protein
LLHFVGQGDWSDQQVLAKIREMVLPEIERHGPIEAWIIDDTGFPKKGRHSVGVAGQYCGQLGKQDNCQVAVTLSLANHHANLPVAYRLYLPKEWVGFVLVCRMSASAMRCVLPQPAGAVTRPRSIASRSISTGCVYRKPHPS